MTAISEIDEIVQDVIKEPENCSKGITLSEDESFDAFALMYASICYWSQAQSNAGYQTMLEECVILSHNLWVYLSQFQGLVRVINQKEKISNFFSIV
jgi:hypothetical protein